MGWTNGRDVQGCLPAPAAPWLLVIYLAAFATSSEANDIRWRNSSGGTLSSPANWTGGVVPGGSDYAHFGLSSGMFGLPNYTVSFTANATNLGLVVEDDSVTFDLNSHVYTTTQFDAVSVGTVPHSIFNAGFGALTITDGIVSVPFQSEFAVGAVANGTGALTVSTGGLIIGDPSLEIGQLGTGTLTIQNNGDILTDRTHIGFNAGVTGTATITGAGSSLTAVEVFVGSSGTGTMNISSSGRVDVGTDAWVGNLAGSTGTANVDGAGSLWSVSGNLTVGNEAAGALNITAGGHVSTGDVTLGNLPNIPGTANVGGTNSKLSASGVLAVSKGGSGTMTITGGGQVTSFQGEIAFFTPLGGHGAVTVDGPNSKWTLTGPMLIGGDGTNAAVGELTISAGGVVQNARGELDTGSVTVEGSGSQWLNSDSLTIGYKGVGTLSVNGGLVSSHVITIADGSSLAAGTMGVNGGGQVTSFQGEIAFGTPTGSHGAVTVDGPNSKWTNTGALFIGGDGTNAAVGELTISAGGVVQNARGELDTGSVTVEGSGSQWLNSDSLTIGYKGVGTLSVNGGLVSSHVITIADGSSLAAGTMSVNGGGQVTSFQGEIAFGTPTGSHGAVTVDGPNSKWTNTGALFIGGDGPGAAVGELTISAGGVVQNTRGELDTGNVTVKGSGSQWVNTGSLTIGYKGLGTLNVNNGGAVSSESVLTVGDGSSLASGTVNVGGGGQVVSDSLTVGEIGGGQVNVAAGGSLESGGALLGDQSNGTGNVAVSGTGAHWTDSGTVRVGNSGNATINITDGGLVENSVTKIGADTSGHGTLIVDGPNSRFSNSQLVLVGSVGIGILQVSNGGLVTGASGNIGDSAGSQGVATVTGANSRWTSTGILAIGQAGAGGLDIGGGALVQSGATIIAVNSGSSGSVLVDSNSQLIATGSLIVGVSGTGNLNIMAGAHVSSPTSSIGLLAGSNGTATVAGAGSSWTISGGLSIGGDAANGGTGTLRIQPQGTVSVASITRIFSASQLQLAGGTLSTAEVTLNGGTFNWTSGTLHVGSYHGILTTPNDGTLAPGNSVGTTNIDGNYFQQSRGTLEIEIGGPTSADLVDITGVATLSGDLDLKLLGMPAPSQSTNYVVFDSRGINGAFINVANGQRLTTADGLGSFVVHYGSASTFDPTQIVLTSFSANLPGDYNGDGTVNAADYTVWRNHSRQAFALPNEKPGAATPGFVDAEDYAFWKSHFGSSLFASGATLNHSHGGNVPEPAALSLVAVALAARRFSEAQSMKKSHYFIALLAAAASSPAVAQPLDPFDFSSLGTLDLISGAYTFNTDTLTIVNNAAPGTPLFTGVVDNQGGTADYFNGTWVPGTNGIPEIAVFAFDSVNLGAGATLSVSGNRALRFYRGAI